MQVRAQARDMSSKEIYDWILGKIRDYQAQLSDGQEVGASFSQYGAIGVIRLRTLGYRAPDYMLIDGIDSEGNPVRLLQHISQLGIMLTAMKVDGAKAHRILN